MNTEIASVDTQPCGCKVTNFKDSLQAPRYQPCLPCALMNAGMMLQEAGARLREERKSPEPRPARDHIDGNRK